MCDGFCSSLSLFILRFTLVELFKQKKKKKESGKRYRHKSMHVSKKQQDYWLIIHDKLEDRFTTITHRCQDFSHKDRCAYITS